jgi:hypothetical protein
MLVADNRDAILLESVKTHRSRLRAAFLFGQLDDRRTANDNIRRLVGSLVLAAVACAACVGVSFVMKTIADQEAARQSQQQEQQAPFTPTAIPDEPGTAGVTPEESDGTPTGSP